jgi:hypothetical protein
MPAVVRATVFLVIWGLVFAVLVLVWDLASYTVVVTVLAVLALMGWAWCCWALIVTLRQEAEMQDQFVQVVDLIRTNMQVAVRCRNCRVAAVPLKTSEGFRLPPGWTQVDDNLYCERCSD